MIDVVVLVLLAASLAALVLVWGRLRRVERRTDEGAKALADLDRVLRSECVPAVTESSRRVATVLDRLDAERVAAGAEVTRAKDGLLPLLEELTRAASQLGEVRVELARLIERAGAPKPVEEPIRAADGAWLRDLVRAHLLGVGVSAVTIDGVVAKPDGSHVVRARGMRGAELWNGNVLVKGGKVESASSLAVRMFP